MCARFDHNHFLFVRNAVVRINYIMKGEWNAKTTNFCIRPLMRIWMIAAARIELKWKASTIITALWGEHGKSGKKAIID